ncbi:MAG: hypothetical protein WC364_12345 [Eubacteriales bacterium]|jgi:hypothetical protein
MNPADIKREILQSSDSTGIRKKLVSGESGLNSDDIVEMGIALENLTQQKGWSYISAYIMKNSNLVGLLFGENDPIARGKAQALILLDQWIQQTILAKNEILKKQNETKDNSK